MTPMKMKRSSEKREMDFDSNSYAREQVVPACQLLLEMVGTDKATVTYKPGVWATHVRCRARRIQFGERCVWTALSGRLTPSDRWLLKDKRRAVCIRDAHDMAAALIIREIAHLVTCIRHNRGGHGSTYWKIHRELFDYYLRVLGDLLRGAEPDSPPFFLSSDPEVLRFRDRLWGQPDGRWKRPKLGDGVVVNGPDEPKLEGRVVSINRLSYHIEDSDAVRWRVWKWSRGLLKDKRG